MFRVKRGLRRPVDSVVSTAIGEWFGVADEVSCVICSASGVGEVVVACSPGMVMIGSE